LRVGAKATRRDFDSGVLSDTFIAVGLAIDSAYRVEFIRTPGLARLWRGCRRGCRHALPPCRDFHACPSRDTIVTVGFSVDTAYGVVLHGARDVVPCLREYAADIDIGRRCSGSLQQYECA
jgi:hypothetical protein